MIDQSTLWLQYLAQLSASKTLKGGEALQAVYPYQPWNWGGREPVLGSYSYEEWAALNVVPSVPYLNSNTSPATQSGFDNGYMIWMNALAVGDLHEDPHYVQLQAQLNEASNKSLSDWANVKDVFMNQTKGGGVTFAQWLAEPENEGYAAQLAADKVTLEGVRAEFYEYQKRIVTPVKAMAEAYENAEYQSLSTDPNSGKAVPLRIWATSPKTPWDYLQAITNQKFGGPAVAGNAQSVELSHTSSQYNYHQYYGDAGGGFWDDFIGVGAEGSYEKIDWESFGEEYKVDFAFEDLTTVEVFPRQWYSGTNLTSFGAGPYAANFSQYKAGGTGSYFFGPGGSLSRIYTGLMVAYRPKVTISAGEQFASYLHEQWKAKVGVEIGPFFFGSEHSGETTAASASMSGGSLVLESKSNWPVVVGMSSAWTYPPGE
jgi:hypothetical protein